MRLVDADELMEHVWRDKLDSRELIANMIDNAPTVKEIPTKIPISIFEQLILQKPKTGHWITKRTIMHDGEFYCDVCDNNAPFNKIFHFCPNCGAKMIESHESEGEK